MVQPKDLIEHASDAALVVDGQQKVVAWNAEAAALLGHSADKVIGLSCHEVLNALLPDGTPLCAPACNGSLCFGRCQPYSIPACNARHRDGRLVAVSISTMVVPKQQGRSHKGPAAAVIFLHPLESDIKPEEIERPVQIFLFGHFGVSVGGSGLAVEHWQRKQALTLLKYLTHNAGQAVHRERVIELLWPDSDEAQGRERLKVILYFLRHQLRDAGLADDLIETRGATYVLNRDMVWIDCEAFEKLYQQGEDHTRAGRQNEAIQCFEAAQRLYRSDYLEEDLYAEWCAEERERLCEIYLDVLGRLADVYAARGSYASAAQICRSALVREPCREQFHRSLMQYLFRLGRSDRAIAQYRRCEKILAEELGVGPSNDTRRLYEKILQATRVAAPESSTGRNRT